MRMKWVKDKKGISPVIGVVLMIAITVILAAVIASFVFGYSGKLTEAPPQFQARLDKVNNTTITIIHTGGDVVDLKEMRIVVKCGNNEWIYDPAAKAGNIDAFGPMDEMDINVKEGKIRVNGNETGGDFKGRNNEELENNKIVEVNFIHKPTGQVVLKLSGLVK